MAPSTVLVLAEDFQDNLDAARAARAIGHGLAAGRPARVADPCPLGPAFVTRLPGDFDPRMRAAHAVIVATAHLDHDTLVHRGAVFEAATRARQGGVPCYALTGKNALDSFQMRILDLQVVLEARSEQGLRAAGKKLASLM